VQTVFLDRDGVINENRADHVKSWSEFRFLPGALEAIARLSRAGIRLFIITNQAIVDRGMVSRATVDSLNQQMVEEIEREGGRIEAVAYCPHRAEDRCACRKPQPGLLLGLAATYHLDMDNAVIIGDALTDMQAGLTAGCQGILVLTGRGREQLARAAASGCNGFRIAADLSAATDLVLNRVAAGAGILP
jgi:D-glycero-D-manno-heptose 1,7-bisphosphate phosphatase